MLEQYLGEDAFRDGIRALPRAPRLRQHRDHRPVGRDRGGHRRAGAPDHGLLDLPGRLPAHRRRPGQRRPHRCASPRSRSPTPATSARATPVDDDRRRRRPAVGGAADLQPALDRRRPRHLREGAARPADASTSTSSSRVEWLLVNTEGTGFYRVRYAPGLLAALVAHAQSDLSPIERYGLVDDAWAGVLAGDHERPRLPRAGRGLRRRDRPVGVAAHHRRPRRPRPPRRRRRPGGPARPGPRPGPPRPRPPRRRAPPRRLRPRAGAARRAVRGPRHARPRRRRARPGPGAARRRRPQPRPRPRRRLGQRGRGPGHRGRLRRLRRPHEGRRPPPRRSSATSVRWPTSPTPSWCAGCWP